jgi:hypothetical protein
MSDTNMPTKAQPSTLTIYPEANGSCSVRNQDGSRGGFFVSYEAARRFVKNRKRPLPASRHGLNPAPTDGLFASAIRQHRRKRCYQPNGR